MFGIIKHIVAGKNSLNETFSVFLVEIHKNVLSLLTVPPIEFCKTPGRKIEKHVASSQDHTSPPKSDKPKSLNKKLRLYLQLIPLC